MKTDAEEIAIIKECEKKIPTIQVEEMKMYGCWITTKGGIIPIEFVEGHLHCIDQLEDQGLLPQGTHERYVEQTWIKVTMSKYSREYSVFFQGVPSAKQMVTLEKVLTRWKGDCFKDRSFIVCGGGKKTWIAYLQDDKVRYDRS